MGINIHSFINSQNLYDKTLIPIIDVADVNNVFEIIEIIIKIKLDRIFLTSSYNIKYAELIMLGEKLKSFYPRLWIGFNFMDLKGESLFLKLKAYKYFPDGLFLDQTLQGVLSKQFEAHSIFNAWTQYKNSGFTGIYFGGINLTKYEKSANLYNAVKNSSGKVDSITIGWDKYNQTASANRIKTAYNSIRGRKLNKDAPISLLQYEICESLPFNIFPYFDILLVPIDNKNNNKLFIEEKLTTINEKIKKYNEMTMLHFTHNNGACPKCSSLHSQKLNDIPLHVGYDHFKCLNCHNLFSFY